MGALSAAALLGTGAAFRLTGLPPAGRTLVAAVTGPDPDSRTIAGILLTRAGDRSVPLISQALAAGADPAELVNVLAGVGTDQARAALRAAARSPRPEVAGAAAEALRSLEDQRRLDG